MPAIARGSIVSSPIRLLRSAGEVFHRRFKRFRRDDQARQGSCDSSELHAVTQAEPSDQVIYWLVSHNN